MADNPIVFYCKDCEKIVDAHKLGRKYVYKCGVCGTKNVAFGTEKSIKSFFRVKEEKEKGEDKKRGGDSKKDSSKKKEGEKPQVKERSTK